MAGNLSKISELVQKELLKPELLPQNLSGLLSYICSQVADFEYGSEAWERQLVPNWQRFLRELDKGRDAEAALRLIPVALAILEHSKRKTPDAILGWLDLMEWAMLRLWEKFPNLEEKQRQIVLNIWAELFLAHYYSFLKDYASILQTEHAVPRLRGCPCNATGKRAKTPSICRRRGETERRTSAGLSG